MLKLFKNMKKFLLTNGENVYNNEPDYDYDDGYDYEDEQYEDDPMNEHYSRGTTGRRAPERSSKADQYRDRIVSLTQAPSQKNHQGVGQPAIPSAVIAHPKEIQDACKICDDICNGKMVIVDLSSLDSVNAQRIADYLGGVVHTLQGHTSRVNKGIFTISPKGFEIASDGEKDGSREYGSFKAVSSGR